MWTSFTCKTYCGSGYVDSGWEKTVIYITGEVTVEAAKQLVRKYIRQLNGVSKVGKEWSVEMVQPFAHKFYHHVIDVNGKFVDCV